MNKNFDVTKREYILQMRQSGKTLQEIGNQLGISRERVRQLSVGIKRPQCYTLANYENLCKLHRRYYGIRHLDIVKFWGMVKIGGKDDCWVWTGCKLPTGYGHYRKTKSCQLYAHRTAFELTNGPIPDGLEVCHTCDNPPCCNPNHLWIGTHLDNVHDRDMKGRGRNGQNKIILLHLPE
jgi:hypothetical protein